MRLPTILKILTGIILLGQITLPNAKAETSHTNFIIILTDDLGYGDLGCYGNQADYTTPELDRMANEGMRFTDFYAADAICTPSRAGLLTGRLAMRMKTRMKVFFPWSLQGMPDEEITIAELLKAKGYATALIGKWHLGHQPQFLPAAQGFDLFWGIPYSNDMSQDGSMPVSDDVKFFEEMTLEDYQSYAPSTKKQQDPKYRGFSDPLYKVFRNKVPLMSGTEVIEWPVDQSQLTRRYTHQAVSFIEESKDKPFFLMLSHTMPHIPLFASEPFKGKTRRGLYGDVIEEIDWSVGQLLEVLRQNGLDKNTVVVFSSDNGPWKSMKKNGGSAGPLRDGKGSSYEGGFRVPGIFWWPGRIPAGTTADTVASQLDLLPTFAAISGIDLPQRKLDGVDLSHVLAGESDDRQPKAFIYNSWQAIRLGDWKYREGKKYGMWSGIPKDEENPEVEQLFNLKEDIGEENNLIDEYPEKAEALKTQLQQQHAGMKPSH